MFLQNVHPSEFKPFLCSFLGMTGHCLGHLTPLILEVLKLINKLTYSVTCFVATEILTLHSAHIPGTQVISIFFLQSEYPISWSSAELDHIIFHIHLIKRELMEDECTMSQSRTAKSKEDECWVRLKKVLCAFNVHSTLKVWCAALWGALWASSSKHC